MEEFKILLQIICTSSDQSESEALWALMLGVHLANTRVHDAVVRIVATYLGAE